jgi:hypothetical protein
VEYPANPVFDPAERAYYPCAIYDANRFGGHGQAAYYKIFLAGMASGNYAIGYAYISPPVTTTTTTTQTTTPPPPPPPPSNPYLAIIGILVAVAFIVKRPGGP